MHIPDNLLNGAICPVTALVGIGGIIATGYFAVTSKEKPRNSIFALVTAIIFLLQMLNFPVRNGTSGHFLGTSFAIYLLGIPYGIISMIIILTIQTFIFADGGITVLGANILNMGFVAAIPSILFYKKYKEASRFEKSFVVFLSSTLSVVLASVACSSEIVISKAGRFFEVFSSMVGIHTLIGIVEGFITVFMVLLLTYSNEKVRSAKKSYFIIYPLIIILSILIAPFASKFPDGLEWVIEKYELYKESAPLFVGILNGYTFPVIKNELLSCIVASIIGALIVIFVSYITSKMLFRIKTSIEKS